MTDAHIVHRAYWISGEYLKFYDYLMNGPLKNSNGGVYFIYAQGALTSPDIPSPGTVGYVLLYKITNSDYTYSQFHYIGSGHLLAGYIRDNAIVWEERYQTL